MIDAVRDRGRAAQAAGGGGHFHLKMPDAQVECFARTAGHELHASDVDDARRRGSLGAHEGRGTAGGGGAPRLFTDPHVHQRSLRRSHTAAEHLLAGELGDFFSSGDTEERRFGVRPDGGVLQAGATWLPVGPGPQHGLAQQLDDRLLGRAGQEAEDPGALAGFGHHGERVARRPQLGDGVGVRHIDGGHGQGHAQGAS